MRSSHDSESARKNGSVVDVDPALLADLGRETSELLSQLIQIDTSNPPGNETAVA
jgi:hypothetical protein